MTRKHFALCVDVMMLAGPACAQAIDPNQPHNDGSAAASMTVPPGAVAPSYDPGTRSDNLRIGEAPVVANDEARAARQADLSRYDQAVLARHRTIASTDARYVHQRRAYAEAMAVWRDQVAACHAGNGRACRAPTPDPAAFE